MIIILNFRNSDILLDEKYLTNCNPLDCIYFDITLELENIGIANGLFLIRPEKAS